MDSGDEIRGGAKVDEVRAEGFDELLFLGAGIDANDASAAADAVLSGVLAESTAGTYDDEPVVGFQGGVLDGLVASVVALAGNALL